MNKERKLSECEKQQVVNLAKDLYVHKPKKDEHVFPYNCIKDAEHFVRLSSDWLKSESTGNSLVAQNLHG